MTKFFIAILFFCLATAANADAPLIWSSGSLAKFLSSGGYTLNDGKQYISISLDPTAGVGYAAPVGSVAVRNVANVGHYYFKSGLANTAWTDFTATATLPIDLTTGVTGTLPVTNGGTGTPTQFTTGSVVFADGSGVYAQDNANFFWDDTNNRLGLGTATPSDMLQVGGTVSGARFATISPSGVLTGRFDDNSVATLINVNNLGATASTGHGAAIRWNFGTNVSTSPIESAAVVATKEQAWTPTASTQDSALSLFTALDGTSAEKARITSSGSLGIGLTAPLSKLHQDAGTGTINYHQFTVGSTTGQTITDGSLIGADASGNTVINNQEALPIILSTSGTEAARILSTGELLVGSTTTASQAPFRVTKTFTDLSGTAVGGNFSPIYLATSGANSNLAIGLMVNSSIGATNSQNWTGVYTSGYQSLRSILNTTAGATGTITNATGIMSSGALAATGVTITNYRGIHSTSPSNSGTVTSSAGISVDSFGSVGTNNTNLLVGTSVIPSGNYSIYSSQTTPSFIAGSLGIGANAAPASARLFLGGNMSQDAWTSSGVNLRAANATFTDNSSAAGTVGANYVNNFGIPTLASTNAVTYTNAANLAISGGPSVGTNATITNSSGLWVTTNGASGATNGYGATINAPTLATNNYAAQFLGGSVGFLVADPAAAVEIVEAANRTQFIDEQLSLRSSRSAIVSGNLIGGMVFRSNDTNLTSPGSTVAFIDALAEATHTASVLDTGLAFSTTKTLATAERMRIDANGNVGVGLTTPAVKMHQDGGNATATYHKFTAGTTTGTTSTDGFDVGVAATGNAEIRQYENLPLILYQNNAEAARINTDKTFTLGVAGTLSGSLGLAGATSGIVSVKSQAVAGTYNFNLPITAGSSGQPLISGGGGATAMSFGSLGVVGGGSGLATLTAHSIQIGNGTTAVTQLGVGGNGTILTGATALDPVFTATPVLGVGGTTAGSLGIAGLTSGTVGIKSSAAAGNWAITLPSNSGTLGYVLRTDGTGITSWVANAASGTSPSLYGTISHAVTTSCAWSYTLTSAGVWVSAGTDSDCPTPSVTGGVTAPGTKLPGFTMTSAPAGTYQMDCYGWYRFGNPASDVQVVRIYDGTNGSYASAGASTIATDNYGAFHATGTFTYGGVTSNTFTIQMASVNGSTSSTLNNSTTPLPFQCSVFYFP